MSLPKPEKVEVGQRWRYKDNVFYTIVRREPGGWRLRWEDTDTESVSLASDESTLADTFLGWALGYGPQEAKPVTHPPGCSCMGCQREALNALHVCNSCCSVCSIHGPGCHGLLCGIVKIPPQPTARQVIEARQRLPKPAPWVESCDPLHWLRDA